jgi:hypothetical protein
VSFDLAKALKDRTSDGRAIRYGLVVTGGASVSKVTVALDGANNVIPCAIATYAANDVVAVLRDGRSSGWVLGKVGTFTPPTDPDPTPVKVEPVARLRVVTIKPIYTNTYRSGWRSSSTGDELVQGDYGGYGLNTGAAFYGNALVALRADTSRPYTIDVTYKRTSGGDYSAQSPSFYTLTQRTKPGGAPTKDDGPSTGTAVAVGKVAKWRLPSTMALHLLNGTDGGLGIWRSGSTPYLKLAGRSDYAAAMTLRVAYYA